VFLQQTAQRGNTSCARWLAVLFVVLNKTLDRNPLRVGEAQAGEFSRHAVVVICLAVPLRVPLVISAAFF
jgi:hypothetical protein